MESIYQALRERKLCRTRSEYALVWLGARSKTYAVPGNPPSAKALIRLHRVLVQHGQMDLAAEVQRQIFAS